MKTVALQSGKFFNYDVQKTAYDGCTIPNTIIITALKHINATFTVKDSRGLGRIDIDGQPEGIDKDALSSTVDITMTGYFIRDFWKQQTYPHIFRSIKIASLKNSMASTGEIKSLVSLCVIVFV